MLPDHHKFFIYSNAHRMLPTSIVRRPPRRTQFIHINREPAAWVFRNPFRPTTMPSTHSWGPHDASPQARVLPTDRTPPCHLDRSKRNSCRLVSHVSIFSKKWCQIPFLYCSVSLVLFLFALGIAYFCAIPSNVALSPSFSFRVCWAASAIAADRVLVF